MLVWLYLSPAWMSPTPFSLLKLWRAQSTVKTPVAARPHASQSGLFTASWLTQSLHWTMKSVRLPGRMGDNANVRLVSDPSALSGDLYMVLPQQNKPSLHSNLDFAHRWRPSSFSCGNLHWGQERGHIKICNSHQNSGREMCQRLHLCSSGVDSQPGSKLIPGWGHAGHSRVSSPGLVPLMPLSSCAQPPHFSCFRFCHWWTICMNSS